MDLGPTRHAARRKERSVIAKDAPVEREALPLRGQCGGGKRGRDHPLQVEHRGHLHISGRKMSKSLKNFITVRELLGRESGEVEAGDVSPAACFRMFVWCHHYRSNITFSEDRMRDAKAELLKFRRFVKRLQCHGSTQSGGPSSPTKQEREGEEEMHPHRAFFLGAIHSTEEQVYASLADDFNTPDTRVLWRRCENFAPRSIRIWMP